MAATAPALNVLTDLDRGRIAQARALAAAADSAAIRAHLLDRGLTGAGEYEGCDVYPFAFGVARALLEDLADLAERLGAGDV